MNTAMAGATPHTHEPACSVPKIAVVIATYRRPALLRRCLEAVLAQDIGAAHYEVVVVDDGRTDDTREVIADLARRTQVPLRYLQPHDTRGPAGARNRGWRASNAPLIAFTDDDTVPAPSWLREGCRAMTKQVAAVGGRIVVPLPERPTDHERNTQGLERAEFATANVFVWRAALHAVGGFDERYTRAWREDSDLHFSLMQICGPVGRACDAVVEHPVRPAPWGVSLRQQANVYFDALLFKKFPKLYRIKVRPRPPWLYYAVVGCTLGALLAWPAGDPSLAWSLAGAALLGLLWFAEQRLRGASHTPAHVAEMLVTSLAIPYLAIYWRLRGALRFRVPFF